MNFIKRAFVGIVRKPGKAVILLVLIFILCNVIAGAISVKNALAQTKRALLEKMGAEVGLEIDWEAVDKIEEFDYSTLWNCLDYSLMEKLAASPYVKVANYQNEAYLETVLYDTWVEAENEEYYETCGFNFIGSTRNALKAEEDGDIRIVEGRCYNAAEIKNHDFVVIISQSLAERNNLAVGDTFDIVESVWEWDEETWESTEHKLDPVTATIIGIYENLKQQEDDPGYINGGDVIYYDMDTANETDDGVIIDVPDIGVIPVYEDNPIYTTSGAISDYITFYNNSTKALGMEDYTMSDNVEMTFLIDSIDNLDLFESENKGLLPLGYKFTDNRENLSEVAKPMQNMTLIANIILYVAVGATVMIITLLITLFLKDRRREMGIYLSLGERKWHIAVQILTEVLVVAVVAVSLSLFSGNVLAKGLSQDLLADQLEGTDEYYYYDDIVSGEDVMEQYDMSLDGRTIALIYIVGLGSVLVSTLVPVVATLRLKPREILM